MRRSRAPGSASRSAGELLQLRLERVRDVERRALADRRRRRRASRSASPATCVGNMSSRAALSPPDADHPDLVAPVHDGRAAQQVEQVVAELDVLRGAASPARPGAGCRICCAARPMSWLPRNVGNVGIDAVRRPEVVVVVRAGGRAPRAPDAPGGVAGGDLLEREVEDLRQPAVRTKPARSTASFSVTSPKIGKSLTPIDRGRRADLRHPQLEERRVHVLRGVDAEPVDLEARDPRRVDLREPVHHVRLLGEEVVEAEEVALLEALLAARAEVDVAAVVVVERVVQPGRLLQLPVALEDERDVAACSPPSGTGTVLAVT